MLGKGTLNVSRVITKGDKFHHRNDTSQRIACRRRRMAHGGAQEMMNSACGWVGGLGGIHALEEL